MGAGTGLRPPRRLDRLLRGIAAGGLLALATAANGTVLLSGTYLPEATPTIRLDLRTDAPFADVAVLDVFLYPFSDELTLLDVTPFFHPDRTIGSPTFPEYQFRGPQYPTLDGTLLRWTFAAPAAASGAYDFSVRGLVTFRDETTVSFGPVNAAVAIPEPSTWALLLAGLAALVPLKRRRGAAV